MNVWELLLNILGWTLVVVLAFIALAFLAGIVVYTKNVVKSAVERRREACTPVTVLSDEAIIELAQSRAQQSAGIIDMFGQGAQFVEGAKFALEVKKGRVDADSI